MNIKIPKDVNSIITTLKNKGYEAYVVGGCVRDSILKKKPKDWDITTVAKPEEIISLFNKVIPTGIKHGTVTVIINNQGYEVTTYRTDGEYEDSRHPKQVEFVKTLEEDLSRRDFTINAMAYNNTKGLVDYFGGINDLKNKKIKTVGDPDKRFQEDALRMLRAIRFSAQLGFDIEEKTIESIKLLKYNISNISLERIRDEFNKILLCNPRKLDLLKECGLLEYIVPQLVKEESKNLYESSIKGAENIECKLYLRLTMLLCNLEECNIKNKNVNNCYNDNLIIEVNSILKRFKYDNNTINKILILIKYKDFKLSNRVSIKKLLNKIGEDLVRDIIKIKYVDNLDNGYRDENLILVEYTLNDIIEKKECFNLKSLKVNGQNLIDIGYKKGKELGETLNYLLDSVIENPKLNNKDSLLKIAKERISYYEH